MKITEKDIFNFVKYRSELNQAKLKFIEDNLALYEEQINFIREIEDTKVKDFLEKARFDLQEKLRRQKTSDIFILNKTVENHERNGDVLNLAADSFELKKRNITDTFVDNKNNLVLKIVNSNTGAKLFLFNAENTEIKDFDIVIKKPVEQTYHCSTNKEPLIVEHLDDVESVEVRIH